MRVVAVLAVLAVLALLVETVARAVAHVRQEPLRWHDLFTQRKQDQMERLGRCDLVFAGSSKMLYGVDPNVVAERTGLRAYNASIYRGVPLVTEAWLRDVVLRTLRPRYVVVGISPTEINDNSPLVGRLEEYRAAKVFHAGRVRRLHWWLGRLSYAIRYAGLLRHPRGLLSLVRGVLRRRDVWTWRVPAEIPGELGPNGLSLKFLGRSYGHGPRMYALIRDQVTNFSNGGEQAGAYHRLGPLCESYGARLVLAAMPAAQELIDDTFEGGRAAWDAEWARLRAMVADLGLPLVDVADGFEDHALFADMVHLNGAGQAEFSRRLGDALAAELGLRQDRKADAG
jgi:hypothetical protein